VKVFHFHAQKMVGVSRKKEFVDLVAIARHHAGKPTSAQDLFHRAAKPDPFVKSSQALVGVVARFDRLQFLI